MADDKVVYIEQQIAQMTARRQLLAARQAKRSRAEDTRRKILAGAVVLDEARQSPEFRNWLRSKLSQKLTRPNDRALFDMSET